MSHRTRIAAVVAGVALSAGGATAHGTAIAGGSPAQRALLRGIVGHLAPARLGRLRIVRVRHGVELRAPVSRVRGTWELLVAVSAFYYRSAARHLPRVVAVGARRASWPTSNAGRRPPRATPARAAAAERLVRRLARASHGHVAELRVSRPDGIAVLLRLRVRNAARFLHHRLRAIIVGADTPARGYDGLLLEVDDARGVAWASGETVLGGI